MADMKYPKNIFKMEYMNKTFVCLFLLFLVKVSLHKNFIRQKFRTYNYLGNMPSWEMLWLIRFFKKSVLLLWGRDAVSSYTSLISFCGQG